MSRRLDLKVGFKCNNNCIFCAQSHKRNLGDKKTFELKNDISDAFYKGCREIVFTGGEPTIRDDIVELVGFAKRIGYEIIQIQTNGRMFSYMEFTKRILDAGATEFSPALHGHNKNIHESQTRCPGSFRQTIKGIKNLKSLGAPVLSNSVITKMNYEYLPELVRLLIELNVNQFQLAFVHPVGNSNINFEEVVPKVKNVKPYVLKSLDIAIESDYTPGKAMVEAFPPCLIPDYDKFCSEIYMPRHNMVIDLDRNISDFEEWRKDKGKKKFDQCKECKYNSICEGPWKEYPEKFGSSEFVPVRK